MKSALFVVAFCGGTLFSQNAKAVEDTPEKERERINHFIQEATEHNERRYAGRMVSIGHAYESGYGAEKNYAESERWYLNAIAFSNGWGAAKLSNLYRHGLGRPVDMKKAFEYSRMAANWGNTLGYDQLGDHYQYGWHVEKDLDLAKKYYRLAAEERGEYWGIPAHAARKYYQLSGLNLTNVLTSADGKPTTTDSVEAQLSECCYDLRNLSSTYEPGSRKFGSRTVKPDVRLATLFRNMADELDGMRIVGYAHLMPRKEIPKDTWIDLFLKKLYQPETKVGRVGDIDWHYQVCEGGVRLGEITDGWADTCSSSGGGERFALVEGPAGGLTAIAQETVGEIVIPNTLGGLPVVSIAPEAFKCCRNLTHVQIPASVHEIGMWAFCGCTNLVTVNLNEGLDTIRGCAFAGCSKLKSIAIPQSVSHIDPIAFDDGIEIICPDDHPHYRFENGSLLDAKGETLVSYYGLSSEYHVPALVKTIGRGAFAGRQKLERIILPDELEEICELAFAECYALKHVTVPSKLINTGNHLFAFDGKIDEQTCAWRDSLPYEKAVKAYDLYCREAYKANNSSPEIGWEKSGCIDMLEELACAFEIGKDRRDQCLSPNPERAQKLRQFAIEIKSECRSIKSFKSFRNDMK